MMKLRLFIIFFLVAFSRNECYTYAQQHSSDERPIDIQTLFSQKEKIYNKLIESFDKNDDKVEIYVYFNFIEEWDNLFSQIINPFSKNKDLSLYYKWEDYNSKIIDILNNYDFGITYNQVNQWENDCKRLRVKYVNDFNLKNYGIINNALVHCLTFPLDVKFHKKGIEMSLLVAESIYKSDIVTDPAFVKFYTYYIELLRNYEKYNNEIIKLIESHRDLAKKNALNKQFLTTIINGIELLPELNIGEYGQFYKKDWSISYLDKTIEKYVNLLKEFASGIRPINYRAFDAFINSYLK